MNARNGPAAVLVLLLAVAPAAAGWFDSRDTLARVNRRLQGHVVDYTHNHGSDRRLWSPSLSEPRDLYVYLPPSFDPRQHYPLILYLHGFTRDEQDFLYRQVEILDQAIADGRLPPVIVAVPDGSLQGRPTLRRSASFYINSRAGNYEDYIVRDVWDFMVQHFPIRPEREAHAIVGLSMGGCAAFHLAIRHQDRFKVAVGFMPPLNLRWVDASDHYRANFDPASWGWRSDLNPNEAVGLFYGGVVRVRYRDLVEPLFGTGPEAIAGVSEVNPVELLDRHDVRNGQLALYVAYGGQDQFNIKAQVESFLFRARERGINVGYAYDPNGKHDLATGLRLFPAALEWLAPQLAPYSPPVPPAGPSAGALP